MARSHTLLPGWAIPSLVVRGVLLVVMVGTVFALVTAPVWFWLGVAAAVIAVCVPRSCAAWIVIFVIVIGVMLEPSSAMRTALALLSVTLIHQLAVLTLALSLCGYVQLAALVPTLQRFVFVQLVTQPLAFLLLLGWSQSQPGGTSWAAALGAGLVLLGVVGFLVITRRGSRRART